MGKLEVSIVGNNRGVMKRKKILPYHPGLKERARQLGEDSTFPRSCYGGISKASK